MTNSAFDIFNKLDVKRQSWLKLALCVFILLAATIIAYHNGLTGAFLLDDEPQITNNPHIQKLWPPTDILANNRRPVLYLTLAINYAFGGFKTFGYHLFNVVVHFFSALILFGIVRRVMMTEDLKTRFGGVSFAVALPVALLWLVHPLQTESVTYIIQRTESLAGLFYLLTIYGAARFATTAGSAWGWLAFLSCTLGMVTKETVATAPLVVFLFDGVYFGGSWQKVWRERKGFYLKLAATWLIILFLLFTARPEDKPSAGFTFQAITPLQYLLTQAGVILYYLRLALVPVPLVFDYYDWPVVKSFVAALPGLLGILPVLGAVVWAWRKEPRLGFLGVFFFLFLSPSSSFVPIADVAFEHRMYLALAPFVGLIVIALTWVLQRNVRDANSRRITATSLVVMAAIIFSALTIARNKDYQTEFSIWQDSVEKRPNNARARVLYGLALEKQQQAPEAEKQYKTAIALKPTDAAGYNNLALLLIEQERFAEAKYYCQAGLNLASDYHGVLYNNLGLAFMREGNYDAAIRAYQQAIERGFRDAPVYSNLGIALSRSGKNSDAIYYLKKALAIRPDFAEAQWFMQEILQGEGKK